jgi:hypothetical protein
LLRECMLAQRPVEKEDLIRVSLDKFAFSRVVFTK